MSDACRWEEGGCSRTKEALVEAWARDELRTERVPPPASWLVDPTGRFTSRYFDGERYTNWVSGPDGTTVEDDAPLAMMVRGDPGGQDAGGPLPAPAPHTEVGAWAVRAHPPAAPGRGTRTRVQAGEQRTPKHLGDELLRGISKVTLQSWANGRMAEHFFVPQLLDLARKHPDAPRVLVWLGLRLQDMERTKLRIDRSIVRHPVSYVTRPAFRAAAQAISSGDGRPASEKVLSRAWDRLHRRVTSSRVTGSDLSLMARVYLAGGRTDKAWESAAAAVELEPGRSEGRYVMAEVMWESAQYDMAIDWAREAAEAGCTLGWSLSQPYGGALRQEYRSTKGSYTRGWGTARFWEAAAAYYQYAAVDQLRFFLGPSCLTDLGAQVVEPAPAAPTATLPPPSGPLRVEEAPAIPPPDVSTLLSADGSIPQVPASVLPAPSTDRFTNADEVRR